MNGEKENFNRNLFFIKNIKFLLIILVFLLLSACTGDNPNHKSEDLEPADAQISQEDNCNSENSTIYIHAQKSGNKIDGKVVISNYLDKNCNLTSPINMKLLTSDGQIITDALIDNFYVVLEKNDFLEILFSWQNGCNISKSDFYSLSIVSNGLDSKIIAPLEDPNGNYFLDRPICSDKNLNNRLEIIELNVSSDH